MMSLQRECVQEEMCLLRHTHLRILGVAYEIMYDMQGTVTDHNLNTMSYIDGHNKEIIQYMK